MGAREGLAVEDELERKSTEISAGSSLRRTYRVVLPERGSGTEPDRKPSEKSHVESAGLKPRGQSGVKTSDDAEERNRRYQTTLAKGLADAVERGDLELADTYEQALGRLLRSIS